MQLFYVENIDSNFITLDEEESKHAVKVLRKTFNDTLHVVDGRGSMYKAAIVDPHHKHCTATVTETISEYEKLPYNLHIAIAPTKNNDRTEWFMEKSTEIGIGGYTMILAEHSERKVANMERLEKVVVSAMKQSIKAYKPTIAPMTPFEDFIGQDFAGKQCFIAHCNENIERTHLKKLLNTDRDVVIMIGPEGDFSQREVELALAHGFKSISLGDSRLRTETAALYATTTVALNFI